VSGDRGKAACGPCCLGMALLACEPHPLQCDYICTATCRSYTRLLRRPRVCILGSRQQQCVNPNVTKLQGDAVNQACRAMTAKRSCPWCADPLASPDQIAVQPRPHIRQLFTRVDWMLAQK